MKPDRPRPVGEAVEVMLRHLGAPPVEAAVRLEEVWPAVVGPALAAVTTPGQVVDGVLSVTTSDAAAVTELGFRARSIAAALADQLGEGVVTSLRVRRSAP